MGKEIAEFSILFFKIGNLYDEFKITRILYKNVCLIIIKLQKI